MAVRIPASLHRSGLRPYLAEFIGTLLLILIGDGVVAQAVLTDFYYANFLSVNLAWASAVALSCYIGAAVNPAITLASAIIRPTKLQWRQLTGKIAAQFLGAFVGAALVYFQYRSAIKSWDPEFTVPGGSILSPQGHHSAGIFATYPAAHFNSNWEAAVTEFLGSSLLAFGASAVADGKNEGLKAPQFMMFALMVAIGASMGWQTGYVSYSFPPFPSLLPPSLLSTDLNRKHVLTKLHRPSTQPATLDLVPSQPSSTAVKSSPQRVSTSWFLRLCPSLVALLVLPCTMPSCLKVRDRLLLMPWMLLRATMEELLWSKLMYE